MKKMVLFIVALSFAKAGFYPTQIDTTVTAVNANSVTLAKPLPVSGMSGVVVHQFDARLQAIVGYIAKTTGNSARTISGTAITHTSLPSVKNNYRVGDSVIGGYMYDNILLLAPSEKVYADITRSSNKNWVHPDIFATFLSKNSQGLPTKENLEIFAKEYQVGLIYIVKKSVAILYDPISHNIVGKREFNTPITDIKAPFYMRLKSIKSGMFSTTTGGNYYQIMDSIK